MPSRRLQPCELFQLLAGGQEHPILHRLGLRRLFKPVRCVFISQAELRLRKACSYPEPLLLSFLRGIRNDTSFQLGTTDVSDTAPDAACVDAVSGGLVARGARAANVEHVSEI